MKNLSGKIIGGALLVVGTAAIWLWPGVDAPMSEPEPIRPIRSLVIGDRTTMPDLTFSAVVKAGGDRTLKFKESGRIARIPVIKGQCIRKGETVAILVNDDFKNDLESARAALDRDRLTYQRVSDAAKKNAISREELSKAEAALRQSKAKFAMAERALAETVLVAPFDAMVADVPGSELDMVTPATAVVLLLDLATIKIDAAVPESIVIQQNRVESTTDDCQVSVTFDSAPGEVYPVKFVEYKATAEQKNQTFTATYSMVAPKDLMLLPGMSATIRVPGDSYRRIDRGDKSVELPEAAVGIAADAKAYVWVLAPAAEGEGVFEAHQRHIVISDRQAGGRVAVTDGLKPGERVATAGITRLSEGQRVRLLDR